MVDWGLVVEVRVKVLLRLRAPVMVVVSVTARVLWRVAAPSIDVVPPNKVVPLTASVNEGVVVAMPTFPSAATIKSVLFDVSLTENAGTVPAP